MDHLAVVYGRPGCVVSLDCRDEKVCSVDGSSDPFVKTDATFVLLDTRVKHDLENSPYTDRRLACERCAKELNVGCLREVADLGVTRGLAMVDRIEKEVGQATANRGRHVVAEICRVRRCSTLLRRGSWRDVGLILYEAHQSLRDLFEASCDELDAAVDASRKVDGILGCRMVGGGFGGAALAVCAPGTDVDRVVEDWRDLYHVDGRKEPRLLVVEPGAGAALDGQPCVSIEELWATSGEVEEAAAPSDEREPSDFLRSLAARPIAKTASDAAAMAAYEAYVEAELAKEGS